MQQIFNFVIRNKTFLLFLFLFGISLALTIQSHSYHKSVFINSANGLTGGVYGTINSIGSYFNLKEQNQILAEENKRLRSTVLNTKSSKSSVNVDSSFSNLRYKVTVADVYKNSYTLPNNYLTINKGKKDSITRDLAVITSKGIVGIVDNTSNSYARVLSILSKKSRINAKLKSTNHRGSLRWDTKSPNLVQLEDISSFASVKIGDTIETGGESTIFPKGIGIGTIETFNKDISGDTYTIQVRLFNDMSNIGVVYILENLDKQEIQLLEKLSNE
ncbi:rod shape-determining protein MreC [uncultured Winogradskyella sp.]|uniref:rod shape-determining protein MreC n=1 Tax=uncultured Winogradskyella sp. TaxID=395353 RepID=UPI0026166C6B|nr:rod shape-determining protein MreC [uncultured Winogradskyella sp.]